MNSKIYILLFITARAVYCSFKAASFCNLVEKECVGSYSYDSRIIHKAACTNVKCQPPYAHQCGVDRCAKSGQECTDFLEVNQFLGSILFKSSLQNTFFNVNLLKQNKLKFQSFQKEIKNCTRSQYKWKSSDVCVSGKMCFLNEKLTNFFIFFTNRKYALQKINCICDGTHTYQCGQDNCSINKQACDVFRKKSVASMDVYQSCGNDLILYEKMSLL